MPIKIEGGSIVIYNAFLHDIVHATNEIVKAVRKAFPTTFIAVGVVEDQGIAGALYQDGVDAVIAGRSVDSQLPNNALYPFLTIRRSNSVGTITVSPEKLMFKLTYPNLLD